MAAIIAWIYLQVKGQDNVSPTDLPEDGQLEVQDKAPKTPKKRK